MTRYIILCRYSKAEYNERLTVTSLTFSSNAFMCDQYDVILAFIMMFIHRIYDMDLSNFVNFNHDNLRQNRSST